MRHKSQQKMRTDSPTLGAEAVEVVKGRGLVKTSIHSGKKYYQEFSSTLQKKEEASSTETVVSLVDDFTGTHRCVATNGIRNYSDHLGKIVVSTGVYKNIRRDELMINEALPVVELSSLSGQPTVFGVVGGVNRYINRVVVNSLGEGCMWVCNINGTLSNGDYITSCEIEGLGAKQDDDLLHNYTVAKITQGCDFSEGTEFEYNSVAYMKQFVGCTYHCG